ncbi:PREDICTED: dynein light chain 1, axonemal-like [Acropora digitifera]|uniref:dynein light chain 1, axonemal-like n=1 Tax=Acropora digitifera TaxID=70779 RepID=UPI00077AFE26|nr:PREDICTED: dynein light chain 1, axonemal-like [Acropora digitifera]
MGRCKKIQELDISRNRISNNLSGLKSLSNLTVLRAGNNDITSLNSLGKLRCLQELYLANNRISDIKSFPNQFSSLEILDLSNNMIENVDEMFVLSDISPLAELSVTGNPFHDKDEFSCHRQISQRLESLEFLDKVSRCLRFDHVTLSKSHNARDKLKIKLAVKLFALVREVDPCV